MDSTGQNVVTPTLRQEDEGMQARDWIEDFSSGYMQRMMHLLPKQGHDPWRNTQNYKLDKAMIRRAPIANDALVFNKVSVQQDKPDTDQALQQASRAVA
jgi:hypothetical protein